MYQARLRELTATAIGTVACVDKGTRQHLYWLLYNELRSQGHESTPVVQVSTHEDTINQYFGIERRVFRALADRLRAKE